MAIDLTNTMLFLGIIIQQIICCRKGKYRGKSCVDLKCIINLGTLFFSVWFLLDVVPSIKLLIRVQNIEPNQIKN